MADEKLVNEINDALSKVQSLYAVILACRSEAADAVNKANGMVSAASAEFDMVVRNAKAKFDDIKSVADGSTGKTQTAVVEAERELREYQSMLKEKYGVDINLFPSGGSTRL